MADFERLIVLTLDGSVRILPVAEPLIILALAPVTFTEAGKVVTKALT